MQPQLWSKEFYKSVDPQIIACGFHKAEPQWDSGPIDVLLRDIDIWYISKGAGSVKIDGKWVDFTSGNLVTIHPEQKYEWEKSCQDNPFEMYYVHLLPFKDNNSEYTKLISMCWPTITPSSAHPEIEILFNDLFEIFTTQPIGADLLLKAISSQLLYLIFDILRSVENTQMHLPPGYRKVLKAQKFIDENYQQELSNEDIAEYADLSVSYLSAMFKKFIGTSPVDYQLNLRLRSAKLLLAKDLSVTEVAMTCGFNSIHNFSRQFRKKVGISPSQFADIYRQKSLLYKKLSLDS